jgi:hypothetical protein
MLKKAGPCDCGDPACGLEELENQIRDELDEPVVNPSEVFSNKEEIEEEGDE